MNVRIEVGKCPLCGEDSWVDLPEGLAEQVIDWHNAGRPVHIQVAFPKMPIADREVLITGAHDKCFDAAFPEEEE
jgi:hypothetical protein